MTDAGGGGIVTRDAAPPVRVVQSSLRPTSSSAMPESAGVVPVMTSPPRTGTSIGLSARFAGLAVASGRLPMS